MRNITNHLSIGDRWDDQTNRRNLLESFAKERGFDPLIADNWYNIPYKAWASMKVPSSTPFSPKKN